MTEHENNSLQVNEIVITFNIMIRKVIVIKLYIRSQLCELAMDTETSETRRILEIMLKLPLHPYCT